MAHFDASKDWVILVPPNAPHAQKAAGDLARYIGLLAALSGGPAREAPALADASGPAPPEETPVIVLDSGGHSPEHNGFAWRAGASRVEIHGESGRGLCNGIYSFLSALGVSWPAPGRETLPSRAASSPRGFPLAAGSADGFSRYKGAGPASAPWRRFIPAGVKAAKSLLRKNGAFAAWAARRRYDALVFPLAAFASAGAGRALGRLRQAAGEYGIALEAGGRDLSSLAPRRYFPLHPDFFRMEGGRRTMARHFCPTSPGAIALIGKVGRRLFRAAGETAVFHLWPDKGAETAWCSCPTCRAFSPREQNRIAVNAAADVLAAVNPAAFLTFYEEEGEENSITLRKNLVKLEKLPAEDGIGGRED